MNTLVDYEVTGQWMRLGGDPATIMAAGRVWLPTGSGREIAEWTRDGGKWSRTGRTRVRA
jgi:hypothetical protein